uniref:C2H2-type domain-containing protein n=1 Tax=Paramormyrops kingsleyae TaxID=1676925 RepID=A0A3B3TFL9_9TELE
MAKSRNLKAFLESSLNEIFRATVSDILESVEETLSEYQGKIERIETENEDLRRRLQKQDIDYTGSKESDSDVRVTIVSDSHMSVESSEEEGGHNRESEPEEEVYVKPNELYCGERRRDPEFSANGHIFQEYTGMGVAAGGSEEEGVQSRQVDMCDSLQTSASTLSLGASELSENVQGFYHCTLCKKTFSKIGSLNAHLRSHVDEKVHCCNYCGNKIGSLKVHLQSHVDEKRPFSCNLCIKSYGHPGQLQIHKRVHTEERPYCCPRCGKSFSEHNQLKVHLQTHMGETTSTPRDPCRRSPRQIHGPVPTPGAPHTPFQRPHDPPMLFQPVCCLHRKSHQSHECRC